ncbi:MAG: hypothetical protein IPL33_05130 [Sphingobacteriales bacterium]|nr:hypothetical protein [Sphingobacteriales bacterium]
MSDQTTSLNYNGDDAVTLRKNGNIIDIFGNIGYDPSTQLDIRRRSYERTDLGAQCGCLSRYRD